MRPTDCCPNCGADLPRNALVCPECGSCEETGWSDDAAAQRLDLPEENFDYDDFVKRELSASQPKPRGMTWFWWITALIVLTGFTILVLR